MPSHKNIHTPQQLLSAGLIDQADLPKIEQVYQHYAIGIPPTIQKQITSAGDVIAQQVVPSAQELLRTPQEATDPIGDERFSPLPGIVHRYKDRALLKPIHICPLYCRFCFRREKVGPNHGLLTDDELDNALEWIASHSDISEIILTGGDPLMLSFRRLKMILERLEALPHITTIRIHTRVPIAMPETITPSLLEYLKNYPKALWVGIHINHAAEMGAEACQAIKKLAQCGLPLFGQTVLLNGINNSAAALETLFKTMVANRIKPYYLHQLDHAPGTQHFHVPISEGLALLKQLRGKVTGLAWPTYVLDIPGGYGKVPLGPNYITHQPCHETNASPFLEITDPQGKPHTIPL
ncbi:lysine-2,3-aminomutase-like protein [Entomobacter blattae]|nr:lysine-2,3-aminomutase-like protein [Entomobacter blattae]